MEGFSRELRHEENTISLNGLAKFSNIINHKIYKMEKKEYKEFYKYLLEIDVIPEPFDEENFDEYLFDNYKSKVLNLDSVSGSANDDRFVDSYNCPHRASGFCTA